MIKENKNIADKNKIKGLSLEELKAQKDEFLIDSKNGRLIKASDLLDKINRFESLR